MVFVMSDTHFYHDNIVKYCWRPGFNPRAHRDDEASHDFELHNTIMADNWRQLVRPEDVVLHLGDLAHSKATNFDRMRDLAPTLPGEKYLILGNHDTRSPTDYEELGFTVLEPFAVTHLGWEVQFDHYPADELTDRTVSMHGHTHNNPTNLTTRHRNMSVDVTAFAPQPLFFVLGELIRWLDHVPR